MSNNYNNDNTFEPLSANTLFFGSLSDRVHGSPSSAFDMRCFATCEPSPTGVLGVHGGMTMSIITGTTGSTGGPNFLSPIHSDTAMAHLLHHADEHVSMEEIKDEREVPSMDEIFARLLESDSTNTKNNRIENDHHSGDDVCGDQILLDSRNFDTTMDQDDVLSKSDNGSMNDIFDFLRCDEDSIQQTKLNSDETNILDTEDPRPNQKKQRRSKDTGVVKNGHKKMDLKIVIPSTTGDHHHRNDNNGKKKATLIQNETSHHRGTKGEEKTEGMEGGGEEDTSRRWQISYVAPQFKDKVRIDVTSKTRCEKPMACVPNTLYSSLKYEVRQRIIGPICTEQQFLLGKITVIDGNTGQEVLKDEQSILKGIVEGALTRSVKASEIDADESQSTAFFEGVLKCQFNSVSFYHKKAQFRWQISYFTPNDLENAVLKCLSAPFQVLARKASTGKRKRREQQQTMMPTTTAATTTTQQKVTDGDIENSITLCSFTTRLESLLKLVQHLPDSQRATAYQMMRERVSSQSWKDDEE